MAGRVRPATVADVRAIAELHVRAWLWAYRKLLPAAYLAALSIDAREQMWRRWLTDPSAPIGMAVWETDGRIRGFVAYGPASDEEPAVRGAGKLHALYVDQELVGQGVGRALHDAALDALRAAGFTDAVLWVLENNALARTFYARQGWLPDDHRKSCPFADEHRLELRLTLRL
jgi:GNAT superfamily N-acetyltransferase